MRKKSKRVIPGFGLSLGVTISILSIVVLIPLASLVIYTAKLSPASLPSAGWTMRRRCTSKATPGTSMLPISPSASSPSLTLRSSC